MAWVLLCGEVVLARVGGPFLCGPPPSLSCTICCAYFCCCHFHGRAQPAWSRCPLCVMLSCAVKRTVKTKGKVGQVPMYGWDARQVKASGSHAAPVPQVAYFFVHKDAHILNSTPTMWANTLLQRRDPLTTTACPLLANRSRCAAAPRPMLRGIFTHGRPVQRNVPFLVKRKPSLDRQPSPPVHIVPQLRKPPIKEPHTVPS